MQKERLTLEKVPQFSLFVNRALQAITKTEDSQEHLRVLKTIVSDDFSPKAIQDKLVSITAAEELELVLRSFRQALLVQLASLDITGAIHYEDVVRAMSEFADCAISHTVRVHARKLAERYGVPAGEDGEPQDLLVVAMGKLGGRELNVSSDVDLVFVYNEEGQTRPIGDFPKARQSISNQEFFERLAKRVIPALNDIVGDGFVFRVDMRLRPYGDSGPIVDSLGMLEEYLYTEGRDWERFAWLKARVINTPIFSSSEAFNEAIHALQRLIQPFVYRKYVDFSALNALTRIHEMIRVETLRRDTGKQEAINVKLGRGGIREIEFIAQTFQVIRGGRDVELQSRETLKTLSLLAKKGLLEPLTCERLNQGYVFLRNLEHAIQYVDDKQTHLLRKASETLDQMAQMLGFTPKELAATLQETMDFISSTFDSIFHVQNVAQEQDGWPVGWRLADQAGKEALCGQLQKLQFSNAKELSDRIASMLNSSHLTAKVEVRDQLAQLVVMIAKNASCWATLKAGSVSADEVFGRYLNLLEVVLGRPTYISLLNQFPQATSNVGRLLAQSCWAAQYLVEHPILLDELVNHSSQNIVHYDAMQWKAWENSLRQTLNSFEGDRERELDTLRDAQHGAVFNILIADINNEVSEQDVSEALSFLADAVLSIAIDISWRAVKTRHCEKPRFAIIGFGKLGARELSYASDLDLVFLYEDNAPEALSNYVKLVRRVLSALSVQTRAGILYTVDTRLRPNGEDGLAVTDIESFKVYEENRDGHGAWLWEHQALTRARFCAGDNALGQAFERIRKEVLSQRRDPKDVTREIASMRKKMLVEHGNAQTLFDVKQDEGGMIDVEFIVQRMVLLHACDCPELLEVKNNTKLLKIMVEKKLLPMDLTRSVIEAYQKYRDIQRLIRLSQGDTIPAGVSPQVVTKERESVIALWKHLF